MKTRLFYLFILLCSFLCGCENSQTDSDDILSLLREKDQNKESLIDCDSLVSQTIDCFEGSDSPVRQAELLFYKARICTEKEETEETVKCYLKALSLLEGKDEYMLFSKIYSNLAGIYRFNDLYRPALDACLKGFHYDSLLNNRIGMCFNLREIGCNYRYLDKEDSALYYLDKAYDMSRSIEDSSFFLSHLFNDYVAYYTDNELYDKAFYYLSRLEHLPINQDKHDILFNKGCLFNKIKKYDSAYYYLSLSAQSEDIYSKLSSYDELRIAAKGIGNYQKATEYSEMYQNGADSIAKAITNIQKVELKHQITELKQEHRLKIVTLFLLFFLLLFSFVCFIIYKHKKNKANSKIPEPEKVMYELSETSIKSFQLMPVYKQIQELPKKKKDLLHKEYRPFTKEEFKELQEITEHLFAGFTQELATACPPLTKEDILYCCLVKLGLPALTIAYCFTSFDTNPLKQRKKRIKEKIMEQTDNKELFESIFPESGKKA